MGISDIGAEGRADRAVDHCSASGYQIGRHRLLLAFWGILDSGIGQIQYSPHDAAVARAGSGMRPVLAGDQKTRTGWGCNEIGRRILQPRCGTRMVAPPMASRAAVEAALQCRGMVRGGVR